MINRGKRSKTVSEVKPVENMCKNLHSFLVISPVPKEVLPPGLKEDNPSQGNCWSHPSLSHIEQEYQESLIQGKIHNQQNSNEGLRYL